MLDVVAVKDIEPDEEIFIDYGSEWEQAWEDHVRKWKSPCPDSSNIDGCVESSRQIVSRINHDKYNDLP
jgi:hypothetical protein